MAWRSKKPKKNQIFEGRGGAGSLSGPGLERAQLEGQRRPTNPAPWLSVGSSRPRRSVHCVRCAKLGPNYTVLYLCVRLRTHWPPPPLSIHTAYPHLMGSMPEEAITPFEYPVDRPKETVRPPSAPNPVAPLARVIWYCGQIPSVSGKDLQDSK